jgi:hypothetical protein
VKPIRLIAGAVGLGLAFALGRIVAAPDVASTCSKLLELAELAGESIDETDRAACEDRYAHERERRGAIGWAELSWCVRRARTIPEAGGC